VHFSSFSLKIETGKSQIFSAPLAKGADRKSCFPIYVSAEREPGRAKAQTMKSARITQEKYCGPKDETAQREIVSNLRLKGETEKSQN